MSGWMLEPPDHWEEFAIYRPELVTKIRSPWPPPEGQPHIAEHRGDWTVQYWVEWDGGYWERWGRRTTFRDAARDFVAGRWR